MRPNKYIWIRRLVRFGVVSAWYEDTEDLKGTIVFDARPSCVGGLQGSFYTKPHQRRADECYANSMELTEPVLYSYTGTLDEARRGINIEPAVSLSRYGKD